MKVRFVYTNSRGLASLWWDIYNCRDNTMEFIDEIREIKR
jgi:hypothetical protein